MKIGMNLLLWTAATTEEHFGLIEDIHHWGFDGIEVPMFSADCSPWHAVKRHLDELGMGSTAVCILPEETSLAVGDAHAQHAAIEHVKACIDSAHELGADTLAGPMYHPVGSLIGRGPTQDERNRYAENLITLSDHAHGSGVNISIEPLNRFETFFLNCQEDAAAIMKAVDRKNVGILYDTFHSNIEEKSIAGAIRTGGKHINHIHISANDRATPGEDHVRWEENFDTFREIGYDGWLTIEAFGEWLPEIAGATCIWRKMAPSAEHLATNGLAFIKEQLA